MLVRVDSIPDEEIWRAHMEAKAKLIRYIRERSGVQFDPDVLTLGFARRFTGYKRATLLFSNLTRLEEINRVGKIQVVFAGNFSRTISDWTSSGDEKYRYIARDFAKELKKQLKKIKESQKYQESSD